jgi:predicted HAD superfamily Cof-like phosphohydrolase
MSDYEKVRDFTIRAGQHVTSEPTPMNKEETIFLLRMALSELQELALTVTGSVEDSISLLKECVNSIDKSPHEPLTTQDEIIAAQADAIVDLWYYGLNAFAKKTVDLSAIFDVVHDSNMAKRDPATGKFIHREDGKIIKPPNWAPPDIVAEIRHQREQSTL